ncbi:MAG: hypothetical protein KDD25_02465 [Bdellovibrionales bacterium]|nr:hypothetical protein [Bdellovibrionales bacterium]
MKHLEFLDRVIGHFTSGKYSGEIQSAKIEFFGPTGAQEDDTQMFEHRISQFLDWYIFDRDLSDLGLTPLESISELKTMAIDESEEVVLKAALKCRHSLFEFLKMRGSDVHVKDLVTGDKLVILESHLTAGFNRDQFFETRILDLGGESKFCRGFCFHPPETCKYILGEVKRVKKLGVPEQRELIARLSRMRRKLDQYKHIKWDYIYTNEEKMRI